MGAAGHLNLPAAEAGAVQQGGFKKTKMKWETVVGGCCGRAFERHQKGPHRLCDRDHLI